MSVADRSDGRWGDAHGDFRNDAAGVLCQGWLVVGFSTVLGLLAIICINGFSEAVHTAG